MRAFTRSLTVLLTAGLALLAGTAAAFADVLADVTVDYGSSGGGTPGGGNLPGTGATAILPLSVIGGALVVLGICLVLVMRRRTNSRN